MLPSNVRMGLCYIGHVVIDSLLDRQVQEKNEFGDVKSAIK